MVFLVPRLYLRSVYMLLPKIMVVSVVLDYIYLGLTKPMTSALVRNIQGSPLTLDYGSALMVYLILCLQIYYFIFLQNQSIAAAFLLGLTTYGIFEFTNKAIFKRWTYFMVGLDTLWGGVLYALTTYFVRLI
jgi:uncharacterized membrane protein